MYGRRSTDGELIASIPEQGGQMSWTHLSQYLFRYAAIAMLIGYLWLAGEVASGLLSYRFLMTVCGIYVALNTLLMMLALFRPGLVHPHTSFYIDCAGLLFGIALDPYAGIPVMLLLFESVIDIGFHHGFKAYRRGLLVAALTLVAGLGLRTQTDIGLQLPGVFLAIIGGVMAFYMYLLLKRNHAYQVELFNLGHEDALTGLLNRRAMYKQARALCANLRPDERAVVMFADLDNLKTYNDRHGHIFGDSVIQAAGQAIGACLRDGDLAARYGGDEFIAVFHGIDIAQARLIAERLQEAATRTSLQEADARLSLSIGLAEVSGRGANFDMALQRADAALYRAKEKTGKGAIASALSAT